jgi:sugar-specific transcriptional regulator TrmB
MKTLQLSGELISSLTELGLLESEAKIYAALVALGYAEVKDLLEVLDVSKPRIYDGLRMMEERGLIVQTSPRPVIYQAIEPKIALEMMVKNYDTVKNKALKQFKDSENQKLIDKPSPPLCYIFGDKSLEFKIQDMLDNAQESVCCRTSEKYLEYIEKLAKKDIKLHLIITSEDPKLRKRLETQFKKGKAQIDTLYMSQMMSTAGNTGEESCQRISSMAEFVDMENMLVLIVDDAELLLIPPIKSDSLSAITSTNKAMVYIMRQGLEESAKTNKTIKN